MASVRKDYSTENISAKDVVNGNSRDLIQALKKEIADYCKPNPGTFPLDYLGSRTSLSRVQVAGQNITRLNELEKKYGNAEIPKNEIMTCLISTGPAFSDMVCRCFEQFESVVPQIPL